MKIAPLLFACVLLCALASAKAAELKSETVHAWDSYVLGVTANEGERNAGIRNFLSTDDSSETYRRLQKGDLIITNHDPRKVPQGLIHHWTGSIFVPDASMDQALHVLNSYDRYSSIFSSLIKNTSVLDPTSDAVKLRVLATQKAFSVTAAVDTDEQLQILRLSPHRTCITANAVRIDELANYGQPSEHAFAEGKRPGYVWRALVIERLEERDGGLYVELQTITLSRGIPVEVRWLIKPLTDELPRRMMATILEETRSAIRDTALQH